MMRSLYSGVSGLKNHQTRMDVVGNNISNVNTTGFKSSRVTFSDTLSQTISGASSATKGRGGTNPKQIGLGSATSAIDTLFTDGSVQSTGVNTDLCLSGNGLFVVKEGSNTYYTRNGNFKFDSKGYYVNSDGLKVQGWCSATPGATYDTKSQPKEIQIQAGETMAATASTKVQLSKNLNAAEAMINSIKATDNKGNKVTPASTNTATWTCGGEYSSNISNVKVSFKNGGTTDNAEGKYAVGNTYKFVAGSLKGITSTTDTLTIDSDSTTTYTIGSKLSSLSVKGVNGKIVTLSDGSTIANNSGTNVNITMNNGDTIVVPSKATTVFEKGNTPTLDVQKVSGTKVTLSDGSVLTNNSATSSTVTLAGGDTIAVPSTATTTYAKGSASSLNVKSVAGTTVTLQDGSVLTNKSGTTSTVTLSNGCKIDVPNSSSSSYSYAVGDTITGVVSADGATAELADGSIITKPTTSTWTKGATISVTVSAIAYNSSKTVDSIDYNSSSEVRSLVYDSDATLDSVTGEIQTNSTSGTDSYTIDSGKLVAASGVTVSGITLTNDDDSTVEISNSDKTEYAKGETYESTIQSITLGLTDDTTSSETSGSFVLGYSKPMTTLTTVYDSLGNAHQVLLYLTKTKVDSDTGNEWTLSLNPDGSGTQTLIGDDGKETIIEMPDTVIKFNTNGGYDDGSGTATLTLTNGATGTQTVNMDCTGLTQYAGSNTAYATADGNTAGTLKSISIDSSGVITGTYTNGLNVARGQVAIAQFNNASGLTKSGNSLYTESNNSGTPNVGTISDLGCSVTPSALEMSNVDMASELTDMIVTQRGYQSNSKIITVSDELLETLINMKR